MLVFRGIALFFILVVSFSACQLSKENNDEESFERMRSLINEMESQGQVMASQFDTVAHYYEFILSRKDSILKNPYPNPYKIEGAFSTNLPDQDSSLSSIIILNSTPNRQKAEQEVVLTNFLDKLFSEFIWNNPRAIQIYSNSAVQVSRVYPAYDAKNIIDPNIDVTSFNFYYEADLKHNPSKGLVWIPDAYVDPAGKGWILSLVHPIYDGDELFAVLGVDYTVSDVVDNYLESENGEFILVNSKGDIVAGKSGAIESLSMPPLKNHVYRQTVQSDNFRISDFNLFNSKSRAVRKMAQNFILEKKENFEFEDEANLEKAICVSFNEIGWYLIEVFPK